MREEQEKEQSCLGSYLISRDENGLRMKGESIMIKYVSGSKFRPFRTRNWPSKIILKLGMKVKNFTSNNQYFVLNLFLNC